MPEQPVHDGSTEETPWLLPPRSFRKKPVAVTAIQYLPHFNCEAVAVFLGDGYECDAHGPSDAPWTVTTLHGAVEAEPGDWIIRGPEGDFWPCKPHIFEASYEEATDG